MIVLDRVSYDTSLNESGVTVVLDDSSVTRPSLILRARRRDSRAWHDLVDLYGPLVQHWCRRCGLADSDAQDCTQEVFAAVSKSLDRFQPSGRSGSFRSWLWTVTINKVRDAARRDQRFPQGKGGSTAAYDMGQLIDPFSPEATLVDSEPTDAIDQNELVARGLSQIRDEFAERTWRIFDRAVIDSVGTAQVAEEFQITPATVRQVRSRVLRRLRQQLGDLEG